MVDLNKLLIDIEAAKRKLIKKAERKGLYENFGQKEVRELEDKYTRMTDFHYERQLILKALERFSTWCSHYTI
jgi:hypothetical protein